MKTLLITTLILFCYFLDVLHNAEEKLLVYTDMKYNDFTAKCASLLKIVQVVYKEKS